jgi:hypothetical protein
MRRWGMTLGVPDYAGITARVLRPGFYRDALVMAGAAPGPVELAPEPFFDGTLFDPAKPERFAIAHAIHTARF